MGFNWRKAAFQGKHCSWWMWVMVPALLQPPLYAQVILSYDVTVAHVTIYSMLYYLYVDACDRSVMRVCVCMSLSLMFTAKVALVQWCASSHDDLILRCYGVDMSIALVLLWTTSMTAYIGWLSNVHVFDDVIEAKMYSCRTLHVTALYCWYA